MAFKIHFKWLAYERRDYYNKYLFNVLCLFGEFSYKSKTYQANNADDRQPLPDGQPAGRSLQQDPGQQVVGQHQVRPEHDDGHELAGLVVGQLEARSHGRVVIVVVFVYRRIGLGNLIQVFILQLFLNVE